MSHVFDAEQFLSITIDSPFTDRIPLPVGEYTALIGTIKPRAWTSKDGTKSGVALDIPLVVDVPAEAQQSCGFGPTTQLTDSAMIDLVEGGMGFDFGPGKNRVLKDYREATDLNRPGEKFGLTMLQGKVIRIKITHDVYEGKPREKITGRTRA